MGVRLDRTGAAAGADAAPDAESAQPRRPGPHDDLDRWRHGDAGLGLLPAWLGTRVDAGESLRVVDRSGTEARGARAFTRGLLVVEVAFACTLLVGATLLMRILRAPRTR